MFTKILLTNRKKYVILSVSDETETAKRIDRHGVKKYPEKSTLKNE